jgi:hypothetical protein
MKTIVLAAAGLLCSHAVWAQSYEAKSSQLKVKLNVAKRGEGGLKPVKIDDTLKSGEEFQLSVTVDRAAYVYAVQFFPDGTSAVLFPQGADVRVGEGESLRIPKDGFWFRLDDVVGTENIYLVAAMKPLADADKEANDILHGKKAPADQAPPAPPPPKKAASEPTPKKVPPKKALPKDALASNDTRRSQDSERPSGLTMRTRGIVVVPEDASQPIQVEADRDGVAIVRFSFNHAH